MSTIRTEDVAPVRGKYLCPDRGCGRQFESPKALGSHRYRAHGVAGTGQSAQAKARRDARLNGNGHEQHAEVTAPSTAGAMIERHIIYMFANFQKEIRLYAMANSLPSTELERGVGDLLTTASTGRSIFSGIEELHRSLRMNP